MRACYTLMGDFRVCLVVGLGAGVVRTWGFSRGGLESNQFYSTKSFECVREARAAPLCVEPPRPLPVKSVPQADTPHAPPPHSSSSPTNFELPSYDTIPTPSRLPQPLAQPHAHPGTRTNATFGRRDYSSMTLFCQLVHTFLRSPRRGVLSSLYSSATRTWLNVLSISRRLCTIRKLLAANATTTFGSAAALQVRTASAPRFLCARRRRRRRVFDSPRVRAVTMETLV